MQGLGFIHLTFYLFCCLLLVDGTGGGYGDGDGTGGGDAGGDCTGGGGGGGEGSDGGDGSGDVTCGGDGGCAGTGGGGGGVASWLWCFCCADGFVGGSFMMQCL